MSRTIFQVGIVWGLCEAFVLLVPVLLVGDKLGPDGYSQPYVSWYADLFILSTSFIAGNLLSTSEKTVKGVVVSMVTAVCVSGLVLVPYTPAAVIPNYAISFLFITGFVSFVLGVFGGIVGSFVRMMFDETVTLKSIYYRTILVIGVAVALVSFPLSLLSLP